MEEKVRNGRAMICCCCYVCCCSLSLLFLCTDQSSSWVSALRSYFLWLLLHSRPIIRIHTRPCSETRGENQGHTQCCSFIIIRLIIVIVVIIIACSNESRMHSKGGWIIIPASFFTFFSFSIIVVIVVIILSLLSSLAFFIFPCWIAQRRTALISMEERTWCRSWSRSRFR